MLSSESLQRSSESLQLTHLSAAFAGSGMLLSEGSKPGQLALAVYCQLEADIDDVLAAQAVKCLVHLSKAMLEADRSAGLAPVATALDAGRAVLSGCAYLKNKSLLNA